MKIKIVGFRVGQSRPTANVTVQGLTRMGSLLVDKDLERDGFLAVYDERIGKKIRLILDKSDFISIRRVDE